MTDVLKIALDRRSKLHEEIAKLDEFIRMAETLLRSPGAQSGAAAGSAPNPVKAPAAADEAAMMSDGGRGAAADAGTADVPRPSIIRRGIATS